MLELLLFLLLVLMPLLCLTLLCILRRLPLCVLLLCPPLLLWLRLRLRCVVLGPNAERTGILITSYVIIAVAWLEKATTIMTQLSCTH